MCAVEAASGRSAINVGKPSLTLSSWIMEEYKLMPEETMMVGDRLDTDVKFGNTGGMKISALVLTGCATATEIEESLLSEEKDAPGESYRDMNPTIDALSKWTYLYSSTETIVEGQNGKFGLMQLTVLWIRKSNMLCTCFNILVALHISVLFTICSVIA